MKLHLDSDCHGKFVLTLFLCAAVLLGGCSAWNPLAVRSQSPDEAESETESSNTRLVRDMAVPFGMFPIKIEAVGLITGLVGTGSDPSPSPQRAALLAHMQTRGVSMPNAVLSSNDTSLVLVRGVLRPGIQKGDHFDVEVRVPSRSETTSLRGGWLLRTRLRKMQVMGNKIHDGHVLALSEGPVLVDPSADAKKDRLLVTRGKVLGGGVVSKSRMLGLVLKPDHQNVVNSARIANAVNKRFHTFEKGVKVGVANAKTEKYIELAVHPRYKDNIERYVQVVRSIALRESASEQMQRTQVLQKQLLDPITASNAALQLEAIGKQGVEILEKGMQADNPEVRFYAAESLAYLDQSKAAKPLGEAARNEPAFRVFALTALSAMDDYAAYEQLRDLLGVDSAETRYGAFRALWAMNSRDPLVMGESLSGQFSYHVLNTPGQQMIHVTRSRRPEIVLFGQNQRLAAPLALEAGPQIMVNSTASGEIAVSKFAIGKQDQKRIVENRVDTVVRTIVELGGTYPDVVQALQQAKSAGSLSARFEIDALPEAGRRYDRVAADQSETERPPLKLNSPRPGLYTSSKVRKASHESDSADKVEKNTDKRPQSEKKSRPLKRFFAKMVGRDDEG